MFFFVTIFYFHTFICIRENISSNFLFTCPYYRMTPYHILADYIMPLQLLSPRHYATTFVFSASTYKTSIPPYVGILASQPPHFLHTVAYGMCSVPPHIPYPFRFAPGALLRKRCFASLARCLYVSLLFQFTFFSKFSFPCGSTGSLKSAFIIEGFQYFPEQVSPCNTKTRSAAFCITGLT